MSIVAGVIRRSGNASPQADCDLLLEAQEPYASDNIQFASSDDAVFAVASTAPSLATVHDDGQILVAADARIDNRRELASALGLSGSAALGAAEIVALAWVRWRRDAIERLVGDFALAVFERASRRLFLARDPTGQRPLFYGRDEALAAFASTPAALLGLPELRRGWNLPRIAAALGEAPIQTETYFRGIHRVRPGECVVIGDEVSASRWWNPAPRPRSRSSRQEQVAQYRSVLANAVQRRMPSGGTAAAHLSAGLDSSAVAATAAVLSDRPVLAFTAAPVTEFLGPVARNRFADESPLAALTASRHAMRHEVIRGEPLTVDYLRRQARTYQEPARNLLNAVWWSQILHAARQAGASVLLNGSLGNVTLNFGGLPVLSDWLRRGEVWTWYRQAGAAASADASWRGVLFNSFAPWLPDAAWRALRRRHIGVDLARSASFIRPELQPDLRDADAPPFADTTADRLSTFDRLDPGMLYKGGLAEAGIVESDPLADRELIEFSLALPPEAFLDGGVWRPLAREALADRVPHEILDSRTRGLQSADWPIRFRPDTALEALEEIRGGPAAAVLDIGAIEAAIATWPEWKSYDAALADLYSSKLPIALAFGIFMNEFDRLC